MGKLVDFLTTQDFVFILATIAFSATVSELRKTYRGKFNLFKTIGEWLYTTILNLSLYVLLLPFAKNYDNGETMLWATTLIFSAVGSKGTEKAIKKIGEYFLNEHGKEGIALIAKGILTLFKGGKGDDTS